MLISCFTKFQHWITCSYYFSYSMQVHIHARIITIPLDEVTWRKRYKSCNTTKHLPQKSLTTLGVTSSPLQYVDYTIINLIKCCLKFPITMITFNKFSYRTSWFKISSGGTSIEIWEKLSERKSQGKHEKCVQSDQKFVIFAIFMLKSSNLT